jgi:hypothetical protein
MFGSFEWLSEDAIAEILLKPLLVMRLDRQMGMPLGYANHLFYIMILIL